MNYNILYRKKDNGIQAIISYKQDNHWRQKSKQGFDNNRKGKKEAKEWADITLQKLKVTSYSLDKSIENISFKNFFKIYLKSMELHVSANTIKGYKTSFKYFNSLYNIKLKDLNTLYLQTCVDEMIKSGLTRTSIKTYLQRITKILTTAKDQYNFPLEIDIKKINLGTNKLKTERKALTKSEYEKLLKSITNKNSFAISLIACKCGLRLGEILGLTWDNINFNNNTITINKQWKLINEEQGLYGFGEAKTLNSNRSIPAPPDVIKCLLELKKELPININNRLFNYKNTQSVASNLHRTYSSNGFNITVHCLRHTYATNIISAGVDFKTASELLGHSIEMTMNIYSHVTDDMRKKAATIINMI